MKRVGRQETPVKEIRIEAFPFRLNLYQIAPTEEITLEELEKLAYSRLALLKSIESGIARNLKEEEMIPSLKKLEDKHLPLHSNESIIGYNLLEERRRDFLSHFILRLAFCRTEEGMRWFTLHETQLFKLRFTSENLKDKQNFIKSCDLDYEPLNQIEKEDLKINLLKSCSSLNNFDQEVFFKVPFEHVLDLVAKRQVFIKSGVAMVPKSDSLSIILNIFKENLEKNLISLSKIIPRLNEEERLIPVLNRFSLFDVEEESGILKEGKLLAGDVEKAVNHFPLCMSNLYKKLKLDSHLKHGGRMQFGLFLKSIGLPLDEALIFWRKAFSLKSTEDSFNKNYAYNIRHNYGQEGKRVNYPPYSCHKIITGQVGAGDSHGCPFKHLSNETLPNQLGSNYDEVLKLVKDGHYQIACTRHFELTRKLNQTMETFVHPSQYYEASLALSNNKTDKGSSSTTTAMKSTPLKSNATFNSQSSPLQPK